MNYSIYLSLHLIYSFLPLRGRIECPYKLIVAVLDINSNGKKDVQQDVDTFSGTL